MNLIKKINIMKKSIIFIVVMLFTCLSINAINKSTRTVDYIRVERECVSVFFVDGGFAISNRIENQRFASFFASLRSGDVVEYEGVSVHEILGIRKVGRRSPSTISNNGVIVDNNRGYYNGGYYTGGGYYGGATIGYTSKHGKTSVGVGTYKNSDGSIGGNLRGHVEGIYFDIPISVKKKNRTVTNTAATTTSAPVKVVKVVSAPTTSATKAVKTVKTTTTVTYYDCDML